MVAVGLHYTYQNPITIEPLQYDEVFGDRVREGVYLEPPGLPREFARQPPLFHDDPDNAGLFGALKPCGVAYPPAFVLSIESAILTGYRTLLTSSGHFMNDQSFVEGHPARTSYLDGLSYCDNAQPERHELAGLTRVSGETFRFDDLGRSHIHLDGKVVVLASHEPSNYGSFLFRVLPKLIHLRAYQGARFLVWNNHPSTREFLVMFGIEPHRTVTQNIRSIYHIEHAVVPCLRNPEALLDPESLEFYAAARERFGINGQDKKIYVSRQNWRQGAAAARVMLNEGELIERLRPLGFDILEPEKLSADEQIKAFSSAKVVVGPQGSGMFNVVFCHPGTHVVDIESSPNWIHAHMCLFGSCKMHYGIFESQRAETSGPIGPHRPFVVNIDALVDRLKSLT